MIFSDLHVFNQNDSNNMEVNLDITAQFKFWCQMDFSKYPFDVQVKVPHHSSLIDNVWS